MSPPKPSRAPLRTPTARTLSIVALLVVGVLCSFAFHGAVAATDVTYAATAVEPGARSDLVVRASTNVTDLDGRLSGVPAPARRPVERAAASGSFEGNVSPELAVALDGPASRYARYDSRYYEWNRTTSEETTHVRIEMRPVAAEAVLENVASPYETAPPAVRAAVDDGSVTGRSVRRGIYRRGDTYYAVAPASEGGSAARVLGAFVGFVLTPVGRGYVAVALGLLAYRYREPLVDRPLTPRRAAAVAAFAVPVAVVGTALFESGALDRFVTGPASAFVVASGLVAGVLARQRRWPALGGVTALVAGLAVGAITLALGPVGLFLGALTLVVGFAAGVVPFAYGVAFGRRRPSEPSGSDVASEG